MNEEYWSLRDCKDKIKELEKRVAKLENPLSLDLDKYGKEAKK